MDDKTILDKIFEFCMVFVGGLISFFFYRYKKSDAQIEKLDDRLDKLSIQQAKYNKSVDYLVQRFTKMERSYDRILKKFENILILYNKDKK